MDYIFDTHAHYDDEAFNEDREELLSGLFKNGVGTVVDACSTFEGIPKVLELAEKFDFIYAAVGVHPTELYHLEESVLTEVERFARLGIFALKNSETLDSTEPEFTGPGKAEGNRTPEAGAETDRKAPANKVVAIGEIGLDYHYPDTDKEKQKRWFALQIDLAKRLNLPIIVHSRDAAADTLDMIKAENARECGGVIHCFSYEPEMAKLYTDMGFYIGIGGVVTFKKSRKLKAIAQQMPMELMLLETDCPYLAPEPFRGRRNNSALIKHVAETVAELRGMTPEEVIRITSENARRFYRLP